MQKLFKVSSLVYLMLVIFIFAFIVTLIVLFNLKVEKSTILTLQVDNSGGTKVTTDVETYIKLYDAKNLYVNINEHHFLVTMGLSIKQRDGSILIQLKGIDNMISGAHIKVTLIYGYEPLVNSLISSGV